MGIAVAWVIAVAVCTVPVVAGFAVWRGRRRPGRRSAGGGLGVIDEIYHPTAYELVEVREQEYVRPAPAPLPGDRD